MIKILVIDDSLFMRMLISHMLNSDPEIEVIDIAKDGEEAMEKLSRIKPDCITLDLAMPGWDDLTTLEHMMDEYPTPLIVLSAHSKIYADITIKCLKAGAVGFVLKPLGELSLDIENIKHKLLKEVKAVSKVDFEKIKLCIQKIPKRPKCKLVALNKIIVIGASTGGPQTLEKILYSLPINLPIPVIIVQHMPSIFFTESLAQHLNKVTDLEVKVAENSEILKGGKVYLAPGGCQSTLSLIGKEVVFCLNEAESDILSPSVDITMKSVAEIYNRNAIGIILSGVGHDGLEGMKAIKEVGGKTIAQDESSLIFGMPKAVIDAGYANEVLGIEEIADTIIKCVGA